MVTSQDPCVVAAAIVIDVVLTAVIVGFSWDDTESNDAVVEEIQNIENVSSAEIIDYRRAIG